jgi:hypothetical protein
MGRTGDRYVSGGVNWTAFTLQQLVNMVADKASVPQLERLADDWRDTGDGVTVASDYLAEALDDLMNFWSGRSADQARHTVALNAQWIGDLGVTAKEMGDPIDEAAGALKSAQEAMPKLPETPPATGSAPQGADAIAALTGDSQLGAAVGGTAAGTESALEAQAEQEKLKLIAVETMQRFEAAALGIDEATPQFEGQSTVLRPRVDETDLDVDGDLWRTKVDTATGVDARWQALTGLTDASAATQRGTTAMSDFSGGFASGGGSTLGGGGGVVSGPVGGGGTLGDTPDRVGGGSGGARPGLSVTASGAVSATGAMSPGMTGPIGAPMGGAMGGGMGAQAGGQQHQRRVPFDGDDDDPFDTGQTASKPVIGI